MTKRQMAQEIARYIFGCDNLDPIPWTEEELAILLEGEPWEDLERVYNLMVERPRGDLVLDMALDELVERHRNRR